MKMVKTLSVMLGVLSLAGAVQAAVIIDFEQATDLNDFTPSAVNTVYTFGATAGTGGSGGLAASGDGPVMSYNGQSYDLSTDPFVSVQLDTKVALSTTNGIIYNRIGFIPDIGNTFATPSLLAEFQRVGGNNVLRFLSNGSALSTTNVAFTTGNWSRLLFTVTESGGMFNFEASLFDLGANGTDTPTLVQTITSLNNATTTLTSDATVYAAFKVNTGATNVDNFVVVPEPASLVLLGLGVPFFLLARRRRA